MRNRRLVGRDLRGELRIRVDELPVQRGVAEQVDLSLVDQVPLARAFFLAFEFLEDFESAFSALLAIAAFLC